MSTLAIILITASVFGSLGFAVALLIVGTRDPRWELDAQHAHEIYHHAWYQIRRGPRSSDFNDLTAFIETRMGKFPAQSYNQNGFGK